MGPHPTVDQWKDLAAKQLKGRSLESLNWHTAEGITVKPLFSSRDLDALEHLDGLPGFVIAVTTAYGVFNKYAKLWELQNLPRNGED